MNAYYIDETGKPRKIKGGFIGIDGKARKIKKGYIGVDNVARLCFTTDSIDPIFANNSWDDVIAACQTNSVPDTWNVGDQLTMTIDGTDYAIDIIGKNHDDYADGSGKAPLTFQLHDCYKQMYSMHGSANTNGSWSQCRMRKTNLVNILNLIPSNVKDNIREVVKRTSDGYGYTTITNTNDKLFLLSEIEVWGSRTDSFSGEGTRYEYYKSNASTKVVKSVKGANKSWWLRSPYNGSSDKYCYITESGAHGIASPTTSFGVSFAFCF